MRKTMVKLILRDAKGQKRPLFMGRRNAEYNNLLIIKQIDNMTTFHALNGLQAGKKRSLSDSGAIFGDITRRSGDESNV